jgi:dolichol-phosphate mannosyltransferase
LKSIIVIPTYNESKNILSLIREIFKVNPDFHILVVDDNSPDGTGTIADQLADSDPRVKVIHRQKKSGLGSAYVAGFKHALAGGYDLIFQMDADFSHQPKYLPDFIKALEDNDLVLGSRYVPGGGVKNWGPHRRLLSYLGGLYARLILGLSYRDLTGGFKAWRRQVLEKIDLDKIRADGYSFQIETTYRAHQKGFKIKEIPIVFVDRTGGKSKMSFGIFLEATWIVWRLRFRR